MREILVLNFYKQLQDRQLKVTSDLEKTATSLLEDVAQSWRNLKEVEDELFYENLPLLVGALLNYVITIHEEDIKKGSKSAFSAATRREFNIEDPYSWYLFSTEEGRNAELPNLVEIPLAKDFYQKSHPQEVLTFLPNKVSFQGRILFALEDGTSNAEVKLGYQSENGNLATADVSRPILDVSIPYLQIFKDTKKSDIPTYENMNLFLNALYNEEFRTKLCSRIRAGVDCANFLNAVPDDPDPAFFENPVNKIFFTNDKNMCVAITTYAKNAIASSMLNRKGLEYMQIIEELSDDVGSFWITSLDMYDTHIDAFLNEYHVTLAKSQEIDKEAAQFFEDALREASADMVEEGSSGGSVDYDDELFVTSTELEDMYDKKKKVSIKSLADLEKNLKIDSVTYYDLFYEAVTAVFKNFLAMHTESAFKQTSEESFFTNAPAFKDASMGECLVSNLLELTNPVHAITNKIEIANIVMACGLLGLPPNCFSEKISILYDNRNNPFNIRGSVFDLNYKDFAFELLSPEDPNTDEPMLKQVLRRQVFKSFLEKNSKNETNNPILDILRARTAAISEEKLSHEILEKCLDVVGIEDVYMYRLGEKDVFSTYVVDLLYCALVDIYNQQAFLETLFFAAQAGSVQIANEIRVSNSPTLRTRHMCDFMGKTIDENRKKLIDSIPLADKAIFSIANTCMTAIIEKSFKPLKENNVLLEYLHMYNTMATIYRDPYSLADDYLRDYFKKTAGSDNPKEKILKFIIPLIDSKQKAIKEIMNFFQAFNTYSEGIQNVPSYVAFSTKATARMAPKKASTIKELGDVCKKAANSGDKYVPDIMKYSSVFAFMLSPLLSRIDELAKLCFYTKSKPSTPDEGDANENKKHFFLETEFKPVNTQGILHCITETFSILVNMRCLDPQEMSLGTLLIDNSKNADSLLLFEKNILEILAKLESWPFDTKHLLQERIELLYSIVLCYQIIMEAQMVISMS